MPDPQVEVNIVVNAHRPDDDHLEKASFELNIRTQSTFTTVLKTISVLQESLLSSNFPF
jgi:hypothetical protein